MQRVCFILKVRQDRLDEYKERHATVWPEMLRALKDTGWNNYSSFLDDTGILVGYLETDDFAAAQEAMAATEVNALWQSSMDGFFEGLEGSRPDESMRPLQLIFQLETQLAATRSSSS